MHALQHTMLLPIDLGDSFPCRRAPRQKHHAPRPRLGYDLDDFLREALPAVVGVAIRFVSADGEAGVEEEDAAVGPRGEEAAVLGGFLEGGVIFFEGDVDVFEGGRGRGGWTD